jgi:hypothetical protein
LHKSNLLGARSFGKALGKGATVRGRLGHFDSKILGHFFLLARYGALL